MYWRPICVCAPLFLTSWVKKTTKGGRQVCSIIIPAARLDLGMAHVRLGTPHPSPPCRQAMGHTRALSLAPCLGPARGGNHGRRGERGVTWLWLREVVQCGRNPKWHCRMPRSHIYIRRFHSSERSCLPTANWNSPDSVVVFSLSVNGICFPVAVNPPPGQLFLLL